MSSPADGNVGQKGCSAYGSSRVELKVGMDSWGEEGLDGEESGEGEALVASE